QGLFTTRTVNRDDNRMRGVRLSEPVLWRWLGVTDTQVITTGLSLWSMSQPTAILPRGPRRAALRVAAAALGADPDPLRADLERHPGAALRRRLAWATAATAAAALLLGWLAAAGVVPASTLWAAAALWPVALVAAVVAYRALGHAIAGEYLVARSGLVNRSTVVLRRSAVSTIAVRESLLQRRLGLRTVSVMTAAGAGGYTVPDLAAAERVRRADRAAPGLLGPFLRPSLGAGAGQGAQAERREERGRDGDQDQQRDRQREPDGRGDRGGVRERVRDRQGPLLHRRRLGARREAAEERLPDQRVQQADRDGVAAQHPQRDEHRAVGDAAEQEADRERGRHLRGRPDQEEPRHQRRQDREHRHQDDRHGELGQHDHPPRDRLGQHVHDLAVVDLRPDHARPRDQREQRQQRRQAELLQDLRRQVEIVVAGHAQDRRQEQQERRQDQQEPRPLAPEHPPEREHRDCRVHGITGPPGRRTRFPGTRPPGRPPTAALRRPGRPAAAATRNAGSRRPRSGGPCR